MRVTIPILVLASLFLPGCSDSPTEPRRKEGIPFETLYSSPISGIEAKRGEIISDPDRWRSVWGEIHRGQFPEPPLPVVDFRRELVVLAAMGYGPDSCHRIELKAITRTSQTLEIAVYEIRGAPNCLCLTVVTYPVHAAKVPRSEPVAARFQFQSRIEGCG